MKRSVLSANSANIRQGARSSITPKGKQQEQLKTALGRLESCPKEQEINKAMELVERTLALLDDNESKLKEELELCQMKNIDLELELEQSKLEIQELKMALADTLKENERLHYELEKHGKFKLN
jgi:hypothetical protein